MICPYCNKEMKLGEIIPKWEWGHHPIVAPQLYIDEDTEIPLTGGSSSLSLLVGDKLQCYYCLDCRKIILDIPEQNKKKKT